MVIMSKDYVFSVRPMQTNKASAFGDKSSRESALEQPDMILEGLIDTMRRGKHSNGCSDMQDNAVPHE